MPLVTHRPPGLVLTDHQFRVPLDYAQPDGEHLTVFAREVVATGKEDRDLPWLIFFQGGPGGKSPRPETLGGWLKRACEEYRVLLLDQRGTGRSTPVNHQTLTRRGGPGEQAAYLMHFRADNIVRDAELIRTQLLGADKQWSILGQSYGGFCVLRYLSAAPEGVCEAIVTGGLPPIDRPADDVYRATYRRVREQNRRYFERYPSAEATVQAIAAHLAAHDVRLPDGDPLSVRRFQYLGHALGSSFGFETLHYLLEEAFVEGQGGLVLSDTFLYGVMNDTSFARGPIYALLHEAIYTQEEASRWSAERVRTEYPEFDFAPDKPFMFTGEMIYPWTFEEDGALRPLCEAAEILAQHEGWPRLYDAARLAANTVPCVAAIYYEDMYVEREFSEETARAIAGCRVWITNEYQHNAIRADGEVVLGRLLDMLRGRK